jgi:hypothetical protein
VAWNGKTNQGVLASTGVYCMRVVLNSWTAKGGHSENQLVNMGLKRSLYKVVK